MANENYTLKLYNKMRMISDDSDSSRSAPPAVFRLINISPFGTNITYDDDDGERREMSYRGKKMCRVITFRTIFDSSVTFLYLPYLMRVSFEPPTPANSHRRHRHP